MTSVPPTRVASSHPRRQDFFPAQRILGWPCFRESANLLRKNAIRTAQNFARTAFLKTFESRIIDPSNNCCSRLQLLQHVQLYHKPTRATIPKMGMRGDDLANRLDQTSYFAWILSQRPSGSREQQAVSRSCCRTRRMELKSIRFPSPSPPPRSSRTVVVDC